MLTANLLPKEEAKLATNDVFRRIIIFFTVCFVTIFIVGAVLLLPSYLPIFHNFRELTRTLAVEEEASAKLRVHEVSKEIKNTKMSLTSLQSFFEESSRASGLMENIFIRAKNITLFSLMIDKDVALSLQGRASTRRDLLEFERSLRESEIFKELSLPL